MINFIEEFINEISTLNETTQIIGCGLNIIPVYKKIFSNEKWFYNFTGKIQGRTETESTIILDCKYLEPKVYLPDYFNIWIDDFKSQNNKILLLNLCNIYKNYGHSNLIIINNMTKIIERFEPHGNKITKYNDLKIENTVKNLAQEYFNDYLYLSPYDFIGENGPQDNCNCNLDLNLNLDEGRGLCVNYSILYYYLRLKFLNISPQEIINLINIYFTNNNILKFTTYVNNFIK